MKRALKIDNQVVPTNVTKRLDIMPGMDWQNALDKNTVEAIMKHFIVKKQQFKIPDIYAWKVWTLS